MAALIKRIVIKDDALVLNGDAVPHASSSVSLDESTPPFVGTVSFAAASQMGRSSIAYQALVDSDKATTPGETSQGAQPDADSLRETEIEARVQERLMEYEEKAKRAMEEAHARGFAQGLEEGRAKGLESGELEGRMQGIAKYKNSIELFDSWQRKVGEQIKCIVSEAEGIIGAIAFEAVCKIIGDTIKTPESVCAVVSTAIKGLKHEDILSIQISPKDFEMLSALEGLDLTQEQARLKELGLEIHHEVELGGCVVQLKAGSIDARIETQFRAFAQSLKNQAQNR